MVDCPKDIAYHLHELWRSLVGQGVSDDLQIMETLAHYLLRHASYGRELTSGAYPQPVPLSAAQEERLQTLLAEALVDLSAADFLNHCLLLHLGSMRAGGYYPTPRHITRLMADLARIFVADQRRETAVSVADFACGSGGLLVEFGGDSLTGVEISTNLARIARANLLLHELSADRLYAGNAFVTVGGRIEERFDAILMNPPFGGQMEAELVEARLGPGKGRRSETTLSLLALDYLKPGGLLATLLPSGSLFATSGGEATLRARLLSENQLEAIIQLPKDALQPYSQLQTYLLLARQSERSSLEADAPVWFYQIAHDGFSSGRNRRPQPEQSQLPQLVAAVAAGQTEPAWKLRDESGASQLDIWPLTTGGYRLAQPDKGRLRLDIIAMTDAVALRLTCQTEKETRQGLLYQTAFWQERPLPAMQNSAAVAPLSFRLADGDDQQITLQQNGNEWQLNLKTIQPVKPVESWQTEQRYWALFIADSGEPLSPLLQTSDLHKDFKPKSLTIVPLADEANELAGSLLLWDSKALQPLFFADGTDNEGWLLLSGHEEAAIIGWGADGFRSGAIGGRQAAFSGEPWHRGVVVDEGGVHFGVSVDPVMIRDERQFDLTFDRYYLSGEQETAAPQSAAEILAAMRQKQRGLTHKLDYLLGIVEMRPAQALPPSVVDAAPFGSLNQSQRLVWQRILEMSEGVEGTITARPFRPQELAAGLNEADVQQALTLLERMGVIVPVVIDGAPYYRRLTERDVVV